MAVIEIISVVRSLHGSWERARLILCSCSPARISCSIVTRVIGRIYIFAPCFSIHGLPRELPRTHTLLVLRFDVSFSPVYSPSGFWIKRLLRYIVVVVVVVRVVRVSRSTVDNLWSRFCQASMLSFL